SLSTSPHLLSDLNRATYVFSGRRTRKQVKVLRDMHLRLSFRALGRPPTAFRQSSLPQSQKSLFQTVVGRATHPRDRCDVGNSRVWQGLGAEPRKVATPLPHTRAVAAHGRTTHNPRQTRRRARVATRFPSRSLVGLQQCSYSRFSLASSMSTHPG